MSDIQETLEDQVSAPQPADTAAAVPAAVQSAVPAALSAAAFMPADTDNDALPQPFDSERGYGGRRSGPYRPSERGRDGARDKDGYRGDRNDDNRRGRNGERPFFKKKVCRFCTQKLKIDYKDADTLRRYITERGKILPRRITGACARHQREVALAVKRARLIGLLPFVAE
jgi:small subunit ribosomal protein S18